MISRRKREHPAALLIRRKLGKRVVGAAELERAHALQVLALEEHVGAGELVDLARSHDRGAARVRFDALVRCSDVVVGDHFQLQCFNAAAATSSPHSWRKWPPFSTRYGSGHPRIHFRSSVMTGKPSTGSLTPIAMKLSPFQASLNHCLALRAMSAPGSSRRSATSCGKRRAPAL